MGIFDSALIEKEKSGWSQRMRGIGELPELERTKADETIIPEALKAPETIPNFDIALKTPSTSDITQKQDILLKFENNFESLNMSIEVDYKQYQEYAKQLDDLEIELQEAPEEMQWKLTQDYNKIRNLHNGLVEKLKVDTAQQKKVFQEYNTLRESYDKDIDTYNKWATAKNAEEPIRLPVGQQSRPEDKPSTLLEKTGFKLPTKPEELKMGIEVALGTWEEQKRANPELQKTEDLAREVLNMRGINSSHEHAQIAYIYELLTTTEDKAGVPVEETIKDIQSNIEKYGSISPPKDWKKAWKEEGVLKTALIGPSEKYGEAESVRRGFIDILVRKENPGADLLTSMGWKGIVLFIGSQAVAGLMDVTPELWRKLTVKVADKKISFKEGLDAILKTGHGEGSVYQRKIFDEAIKKADKLNISVVNVLKKGLTITEVTPRFAFGTKLYGGLPADEIVKSLVKVGKITAEISKELSLAKPELVSQVIQNLSIASPAIASKLAPELVKLIPEEKVEPTPKVEPKEPEIITDPAKVQEVKESITEGELILKTGKSNDRKLSEEELTMVQRSVDNAKRKIGLETPEKPPVPKVEPKAPWQMTKKEYIGDTIWIESAKNEHIQSVIGAIKEGKPVPTEVLADYPDLKQLPEAKKPMIRGINFEENPEVYRVVAKADEIIEKAKLKIKYPLNEIDIAIKELKDAMMDETLNVKDKKQVAKGYNELRNVQKDIEGKPTEYTEIEIPEAEMLPEGKKPTIEAIPKATEPLAKTEPKPEPTKEDFEALKTTDKNKELFYEKYNEVYTETKKSYDRLIDEKVAELKEEGFKGVEKGGLKRTEEGEVIGAYPTISKNPKWYRDFYEANDRQPTNRELREIAIEQLLEGYNIEEEGHIRAEIPANKIFATLNTQLETLDIILSDIKEGNYSFKISGNTLKLNKELDKLRKEIGKVKKDYETQLAKQITESQRKFIQLSGELARQKKLSTKEDVKRIKDLETEKVKTEKDIEKLKAKLKEARSKVSKPTPKRVKTKVREITGQIPGKIEIAERDILRLVLRGEAKGARKAFAEGKKAGIFGQKEHFAEVVGRAKERKAKTEEIGKIKDILKKTKLRELRPERQKAIKNIIDEIDLKRMTEKTKRKLTSRLDYIKENPDNKIPQEKIDELSRLNKKPISDFTAEDIALIKDSILHEINLNKLKNKIVFGKEIREAAGELKEARANVLEGKDTIKDDSIIDSGESEHKSLWQRIGRIWGINSLNPEVICEELDNKDHGIIMKYVFNGLDKGITDKLGIMQEANAWLKEEIGDINLSKWSKAFQAKRNNIDFQEIKLGDGRTIKITKGERVSFLLHEKNEKNFAHLTEGGFRFSDNLARRYEITEENLDEIINSATKEEVKVADTLWKFFNEFIKPKLNETSMELNGWEVATEDNYFPIRTVALDRIRDALKAQRTFDNKTLEGMGIFKERTNAKNALIIEDAFTVAFKHLEGTSSYIGLAKPLRYAKLILEDTEFQENVMKAYGKDYIDNLKRYLQEIEDDQLNYDNVDKLTVELINKLDSAILGMHIFVAFKQPVSYIGACTEIDSRFLARATIKKNDYAEIRKHSPQLFQRLEGHITRELGELGNVGKVRRLFLNKSPLSSKILYLIKAFDSFTIGKIWSAVKLEVKEKYPDISQEEYMNKVTDRAEEVIRRTQPTWHTKDRSEIGRSKSIAIRLITKYTSQRNKNRIILKRATLNYNRSNHSAWDKITLMKKYSIILIVNALLIGAIDELRRRAYGRKSKSLWQYAIGTIGTALSNFYFVGDIFSSLASKIQKGTYAGYDTGNIVSSYIDTAIDGISEVGNAIEQLYGNERYKSGSRKGDLKWKTTALRALDRNASTLLALKGLPYNNVKNLISGVWKMAGDKEETKQMPIGEIDLDKIFKTIEKLPSGEIDLDKIFGD